jgi:hypothetical protein
MHRDLLIRVQVSNHGPEQAYPISGSAIRGAGAMTIVALRLRQEQMGCYSKDAQIRT